MALFQGCCLSGSISGMLFKWLYFRDVVKHLALFQDVCHTCCSPGRQLQGYPKNVTHLLDEYTTCTCQQGALLPSPLSSFMNCYLVHVWYVFCAARTIKLVSVDFEMEWRILGCKRDRISLPELIFV